jgi:hypothetical protein
MLRIAAMPAATRGVGIGGVTTLAADRKEAAIPISAVTGIDGGIRSTSPSAKCGTCRLPGSTPRGAEPAAGGEESSVSVVYGGLWRPGASLTRSPVRSLLVGIHAV